MYSFYCVRTRPLGVFLGLCSSPSWLMLALRCASLRFAICRLDRPALLVIYQGSLFLYSRDVPCCHLKPLVLPCHEDQLLFLGMTGCFSVSSGVLSCYSLVTKVGACPVGLFSYQDSPHHCIALELQTTHVQMCVVLAASLLTVTEPDARLPRLGVSVLDTYERPW